MALVSMKQEREGDGYAVEADNEYGYGLSICLSEDQVEALGLKANPPAAGTVMNIRAIAQVVTVTQDADVDGDNDGIDVTLRLQITDMELTPGGSPDYASMLYGGSNG
jgi:hypothetical protein